MTINFQLITPEKKYFEDKVNMVVIPGEEGDFGVMKEHSPVVTIIRPGLLEIFSINNEITNSFFVDAGFVKVTRDDCTVLAENIILMEEINIKDCESKILQIRNKSDKENVENDIQEIKVLEAMISSSSKD